MRFAIADAQITEAFLYYESQQEGLGGRFLDCVELAILEITRHPFTYQKKYNQFRTALLKPFPYLIFFEVVAKNVVVYKVLHAQRNPRKYFKK